MQTVFGEFKAMQDARLMEENIRELNDPFAHKAPAWMRATLARELHRRNRDQVHVVRWEEIDNGN